MGTHVYTPEAFSNPEVCALLDCIAASGFVNRSTLRGSFYKSRGFAVTLRTAGVARLRQELPPLAHYVERVLRDPKRHQLCNWRQRLQGTLGSGKTNALYLNVLALPPGSGVGAHVDATLRTPSGVPELIPRMVSVLYLQPGHGGLLKLYEGNRLRADIEPQRGALLHFRGDLRHEVLTGDAANKTVDTHPPYADDVGESKTAPTLSPRTRVSLVCEQYSLKASALRHIPQYELHSKAPFETFLQRAQNSEHEAPFEVIGQFGTDK